MKYRKNEILEILKSSHKQRIQIETDLPRVEELKYELTIRNWIDEFDLVEWDDLCKYYSRVFEIVDRELEFRNLMSHIREKTVEDFCIYISEFATKPILHSVKLFGNVCEEAGIFKYLVRKLACENEVKAKELRPSSRIDEYMDDFASVIVTEVNKIDSKILPKIKYERNEFEKQSHKLFGIGFGILIVASIADVWFIGGIGVGVVICCTWMSRIAAKLRAKRFEFEGIETFRDLVELVKVKKHGIQL